jgi:hypothetical protein
MAMTRKDFRRWTEDPTLKGERERKEEEEEEYWDLCTQNSVNEISGFG